MPSNLSGLGNVSYNGVDFTGPYLKSSLTATPVKDDTNRVVKWIKISIMLQTYLTNNLEINPTIDNDIEGMRARLYESGKVLTYESVGYGTKFSVGPGQTLQDLNYGPDVEQVTFETMAAQVMKLTFRVSTCVPERCFVIGSPGPGQPLAISWSWDTEVRRGGWLTVRWQITCEIGLSLTAGRTILAVADQLKGRLAPILLPGFRREPGQWRLSADKRRLTGTITDIEIPAPMPPGLDFITARHSAHSGSHTQTAAGVPGMTPFFAWSHQLHITAHRTRNMSKAELWQRIYLILGTYLAYARAATPQGGATPTPVQPVSGGNGQPSGPPTNWVATLAGVVLVVGNNPIAAPLRAVSAVTATPGQPTVARMVYISDFRIDDDIFGDEVTVTMTYQQVGSSLHNILNDGGFFRPLPGVTWAAWLASCTGPAKPFDVRGGAQLAYTPAMEGLVVDLCNERTSIVPAAQPETEPCPALDWNG